MEFHVNHPILYILVAVLIAVVLGQSVYFLVKALRRRAFTRKYTDWPRTTATSMPTMTKRIGWLTLNSIWKTPPKVDFCHYSMACPFPQAQCQKLEEIASQKFETVSTCYFCEHRVK